MPDPSTSSSHPGGSTGEPPCFLAPAAPHADLARAFHDALLRCDRREASRLILDAVARGVPVKDVYLEVFQRSQREVGRLWQLNRLSVAQEHYCSAATQMIMSQLYPHIFAADKTGRRVVAACVGGELHEIGARMVADFLEMDGWDTFYLGANTPTPAVVDSLATRRAHLLALSATLVSHVAEVGRVIAAVRAAPACAGVKILVGGWPFTTDPALGRTVGADAAAADACSAVATAHVLVPA